MVKGTTRRVIVVKPSDKLFDEAIFIVRDTDDSPGVTGDTILQEAQKAAHDFMRSNLGGRRVRISLRNAFWAAMGAAAASVLWGAAVLLLRLF